MISESRRGLYAFERPNSLNAQKDLNSYWIADPFVELPRTRPLNATPFPAVASPPSNAKFQRLGGDTPQASQVWAPFFLVTSAAQATCLGAAQIPALGKLMTRLRLNQGQCKHMTRRMLDRHALCSMCGGMCASTRRRCKHVQTCLARSRRPRSRRRTTVAMLHTSMPCGMCAHVYSLVRARAMANAGMCWRAGDDRALAGAPVARLHTGMPCGVCGHV